MKLTNKFSFDEISRNNSFASKNDRNSSREYAPSVVIDFIENKPNEVEKILNDVCMALTSMDE